MSGLNELNFDGEFTWPAQEQGRQDAMNALGGGASNVAGFLAEWLQTEETLREQFRLISPRVANRRATSLHLVA